MRRLLGLLAVLALLGTVAGCYRGRGICDCLDYRDPCCYGCYCYGPADGCGGCANPGGGQEHVAGTPLPAIQGEPLKVMPKEIEKVPPPVKDKEPPPANR